MKQVYFFFFLLFFSFSQAQIVTIPDANFKNVLLTTNCADFDGDNTLDGDVDTNNDGEIQVSEAQAVIRLIVYSSNISDLTGIETFTNLTQLACNNNLLTTIDLSQNTNLVGLFCYNNQISSLNLTQNTSLEQLVCNHNQLTSLDLSANLSLGRLECSYNLLTSLDITPHANIYTLYCNDNELNNLLLPTNGSISLLSCSNNQLSSLDVSENVNLYELKCYNNQLTSLDVTLNTNLNSLECYNNQLTSLDVTLNDNLEFLKCENNLLTEIDVTQNPSLRNFRCGGNQLSTIDVTQNPNLTNFYCGSNQLTDLDVSQNTNLIYLTCSENQLTSLDLNNHHNLFSLSCSNNQLTSLFVKNGTYQYTLQFEGNPNLSYICADENQILDIQSIAGPDVVVNSYCFFTPGGDFYTIEGQVQADLNSNGCDANDTIVSSLKFNITDGTDNGAFFSDQAGSYNIPLQEGMYTITPGFENIAYWTVSPSSFTVDFPTNNSPFIQDICVVPDGTYSDLEVYIVTLVGARPGFDADYKLVYKNKGNTVLSGSVYLTFQDELMDLVSALPVVNSQAPNVLTWNFTDLQPFENREIDVIMNINTPTDTPPVNTGDILEFIATINHSQTEETLDDNTFILSQTVVNSYDPNDKTCLEGETVTTDKIGEYVHYMIRFENTGTAEAVNIVVKDVINIAKLDVSTLIPLSSNHDFWTRINDNVVEFIFEDIYLPFDDANNDGYVAFKIKTQNTLQVNDTFENEAEIYFDYNAPIITDENSVLISNTLTVEDFVSQNVKVYPNPVMDVLHLELEHLIDAISIYDLNGRLLNTIQVLGQHTFKTIDMSKLQSGTYFVRISFETSFETIKIVKR